VLDKFYSDAVLWYHQALLMVRIQVLLMVRIVLRYLPACQVCATATHAALLTLLCASRCTQRQCTHCATTQYQSDDAVHFRSTSYCAIVIHHVSLMYACPAPKLLFRRHRHCEVHLAVPIADEQHVAARLACNDGTLLHYARSLTHYTAHNRSQYACKRCTCSFLEHTYNT
jgi:hypothetical protein